MVRGGALAPKKQCTKKQAQASPIMVNDRPEPACPYAKTAMLYPCGRVQQSTRSHCNCHCLQSPTPRIPTLLPWELKNKNSQPPATGRLKMAPAHTQCGMLWKAREHCGQWRHEPLIRRKPLVSEVHRASNVLNCCLAGHRQCSPEEPAAKRLCQPARPNIHTCVDRFATISREISSFTGPDLSAGDAQQNCFRAQRKCSHLVKYTLLRRKWDVRMRRRRRV